MKKFLKLLILPLCLLSSCNNTKKPTTINEEIENIKQCLSADSLDFSEYNDVTIRRLVEYIRVMKDNSIIIVLKGGMQIQENI